MARFGILLGSLLATMAIGMAVYLTTFTTNQITGGALFFVGIVVALRVWMAGLVRTGQRKLWGWFVPMLLFPPVTLLYGICGPEPLRPYAQQGLRRR